MSPGASLHLRAIPVVESTGVLSAFTLAGMIRGNSSCARNRRPRPGAATWALARTLLLALMMIHRWLPRMTRGKARVSLLKFIRKHTGMMEHIFRCLLVCMHAAPAAAKPAPFIPRATDADRAAPSGRRSPPSFSIGLAQLAAGFARYGAPVAALENRKRPQRPDKPPPRGHSAAAPIADPIAQLEARLNAMRALLDDPHPHAAKLALRLSAAGIRLRRLKPLIPGAEIWALLSHAPLLRALPPDRLIADTS